MRAKIFLLKSYYHSIMAIEEFKTIRDDSKELVEINITTGKKHTYKKNKDGVADPDKYCKVHRKDFLQPFGKTKKEFEEVYGKGSAERAMNGLKKVNREELKRKIITNLSSFRI